MNIIIIEDVWGKNETSYRKAFTAVCPEKNCNYCQLKFRCLVSEILELTSVELLLWQTDNKIKTKSIEEALIKLIPDVKIVYGRNHENIRSK